MYDFKKKKGIYYFVSGDQYQDNISISNSCPTSEEILEKNIELREKLYGSLLEDHEKGMIVLENISDRLKIYSFKELRWITHA